MYDHGVRGSFRQVNLFAYVGLIVRRTDMVSADKEWYRNRPWWVWQRFRVLGLIAALLLPDRILLAQADTAAWFGKLKDARDLTRQAIG